MWSGHQSICIRKKPLIFPPPTNDVCVKYGKICKHYTTKFIIIGIILYIGMDKIKFLKYYVRVGII